MARSIKIGTRGSKMALSQTQRVVDALSTADATHNYEIVVIKTTGDKFMGDLKKLGGKGAFVKEIERALLDGDIDLAMHSMKDVPGDVDLPEGLVIPAVLSREDIRDVVVCREGGSFVDLKDGAKVGTSAPRRAAILNHSFPYLDIIPIRGAADTRIAKLDNGEVDALILAKSGLERIGLAHRISEVFEPDMMCPAIGQGVVGVECRADDALARELLAKINHHDTFICITAERTMLRRLQGNCYTPIAGYCEITKGGSLRMIAHVTSPDGSNIVRARQKMPFDDPAALGLAVAKELLNAGAAEIIDSLKYKAS